MLKNLKSKIYFFIFLSDRGKDFVDIVGNSGRVWGTAIKATEESSDPMIISVGSKISLKTALELIKQVCIYRVPEPVNNIFF